MIPLTVIGIDMIIATLPLAALLVVMIVQSIDPSVTIDAQLAKNMLWFFGHPVVYLLLFPAVSIFYLLIPRYANKKLVAGKVVAFAWFVAVVVNVIVWAHHIYLDYPDGHDPGGAEHVDAAADVRDHAAVGDQPLQPLGDDLALGLPVDARGEVPRRRDAELARRRASRASSTRRSSSTRVIHNTMWIVGHFHNMALLNIGLVDLRLGLRVPARS